MKHPFFASIDWKLMMQRKLPTPYIPVIQDPTDPCHFDQQQTTIPVHSPTDKNVLYDNEENADEFSEFYFSPNEGASYMSGNDFVQAVNKDEKGSL